MSILPFCRKSYEAKIFRAEIDGLHCTIAGTLEGDIDLAICTADGESRTYQISPEGARALAGMLMGCADDVRDNCLFDRDPLLVDPQEGGRDG